MPKKTSPVAVPLEDVRSLPVADNPIGRQLQEITVLTRAAADHLGTTLGINRTDLAALEQLMTNGPLAPTELASRLNVTTAGITLVIDRLERAGHVVRERQAEDKRRVLVKPVQASVAQTYRHLGPMLMSLNTVLDALSPSEHALIEQFLNRVINAYRTTLPGATTDLTLSKLEIEA
ncbi:MarR family winged helix-turn-helix transcriptional regulator [Erwinia sp. AnSW2-5]|uniref:MarR family winged helix-turn-helix transcriptional regulator n=1 Tax=Erwinia sp. AnSW2-5 TaxID=3367692 RepID=UPI00385E4F90